MTFKIRPWKNKKLSKQRVYFKKLKRSCNNEYGAFGLKAVEPGKISIVNLEVIRRFLMNKTKRKAKLWARISPDKHTTKKPAEVRMGRGKGSIDHWYASVFPGQLIFEINMNNKTNLKKLLKLINHKIPVKTKIVKLT